jgi:hypothetical protein
MAWSGCKRLRTALHGYPETDRAGLQFAVVCLRIGTCSAVRSSTLPGIDTAISNVSAGTNIHSIADGVVRINAPTGAALTICFG